jgi:hypothetical protein
MNIDSRLITDLELKQYGGINKNINNELLYMNVPRAQRHLASILGWNFYKHILQSFDNNTLTSNELVLLNDYLKQAIASRAAYYSIKTTNIPVTEKGPQSRTSEFSQTVASNNLAELENLYSNWAFEDESLLLHYLLCNYELYPEYDINVNRFYKKPINSISNNGRWTTL